MILKQVHPIPLGNKFCVTLHWKQRFTLNALLLLYLLPENLEQHTFVEKCLRGLFEPLVDEFVHRFESLSKYALLQAHLDIGALEFSKLGQGLLLF